MPVTLAFDVYGTLIDTQGVTRSLAGMIGERSREFSLRWRDKQLEYSFRRGLMDSYQDFSQCTAQALEYCNQALKAGLSESQKEQLMLAYRGLPAFEDARAALEQLAPRGYRIYAFSNGRAEDVDGLLLQAGIRHWFRDIVSVDEIGRFKPDPRVYQHFLKRSDSSASDAWLISGNPFDLLGALNSGLNAAWVRRQPDAPFDPWGPQPSCQVSDLVQLAEELPQPKR